MFLFEVYITACWWLIMNSEGIHQKVHFVYHKKQNQNCISYRYMVKEVILPFPLLQRVEEMTGRRIVILQFVAKLAVKLVYCGMTTLLQLENYVNRLSSSLQFPTNHIYLCCCLHLSFMPLTMFLMLFQLCYDGFC